MGRSGWAMSAAIAIAAAIALWAWWRPGPSQMAGQGMTTPGTQDIASGDAIVEVAMPDALSDNASIGQRVFAAKCAQCHGASAQGQAGVAPPLVHKIYEPGHHSDMAFVMAAKNGVRAHHWNFGNMPPVEGVTDGDVKMIVHYVRELQQANGIK